MDDRTQLPANHVPEMSHVRAYGVKPVADVQAVSSEPRGIVIKRFAQVGEPVRVHFGGER